MQRSSLILTRDGKPPKAESLDLRRELVFETKEINLDEKERTVSLAFCSEAPYERWFGMEVLDCSPGACNLSRLNNGGALLKEHDRNRQTGVVVASTAKMENKRGVCTVKFSRSQLGSDEMQDVKDGIRTRVSVGYIVHEMVLEKQVDGMDYFRVTKWEPYEVSIVSIPADPTVGVGKLGDQILTTKEERISMLRSLYPHLMRDAAAGATSTGGGGGASTTPTIAVVTDAQRDGFIKGERERIANINSVAEQNKERTGLREFADKAIREGTSVDDFNREFISKFLRGTVTPVGTHTPEIGMTQKDVKRFSLLKACRDMAVGRLEGIEKEACEAAQKQMKRSLTDARAFVIPEEVNRTIWEETVQRMIAQQMIRAQNVTTFTAGGATVGTSFGPMIEFLRNKTLLGKLGITMMDGLVGDLILPVQTGGATAYWVSETGALTDSQATFAQKAMTPHRLGATIPFTTQFLAQTSLSAEDFFRNEMQTVCALKRDLAGIEGTGTDGQPLGIKNTTGINATVTFGGAPTWADVVQFETGITADNADVGTMGFALSTATVGKWKTTLRDSVAGAVYLIDKGDLNGYGYERTNQITGDIVFFGVWSQLINATWAGVEIIVDPYALKKSGQIEITRNELTDYLVKQPLAFNVSTDSGAQ